MTQSNKRKPKILKFLDHIYPQKFYTAGDISLMLGIHETSITRLFERYSVIGKLAFCERPNGGIVQMRLYFGEDIINAFQPPSLTWDVKMVTSWQDVFVSIPIHFLYQRLGKPQSIIDLAKSIDVLYFETYKKIMPDDIFDTVYVSLIDDLRRIGWLN